MQEEYNWNTKGGTKRDVTTSLKHATDLFLARRWRIEIITLDGHITLCFITIGQLDVNGI